MNSIHIVREAGGLGDIIRISAVLDALADKFPDRPIEFDGPERYRPVLMDGHCRGMARPGCLYHPTDGLSLRATPRGALMRNVVEWRGGEVIDLFCPAWRHEQQSAGAPTIERTACWAEGAGVQPRQPEYRVQSDEDEEAELWLYEHGGLDWKRHLCLGIHPRAAGVIRNCRPSFWRALDAELQSAGRIPLWFDDSPDYLRTTFDTLDGRAVCIGQTIPMVAALLRLLPAVVAVDSGLFHLAAAVRGPQVLGLFGPTNGALISSIYDVSRVHYVQTVHTNAGCAAPCYGYSERGFTGAGCLDGCLDLADLDPISVARQIVELAP